MPSTAIEHLTPKGQQLEVLAALRNQRSSLIAMHRQLGLNTPESSELARLITETRRSIEALESLTPRGPVGDLSRMSHEDAKRALAWQRGEDPPRRFDVMPGRRWIHVAEYLSNGQRTARWSFDTREGVWYTSEGWKRPNMRGRIGAAQSAEIERLLEGKMP